MAARFVNIDRDTPMLLPCDLRQWVPPEHVVHFILDAVAQVPTEHFRINHRGTGSEQYPPAMMLALLIYCYATGRSGSRTMEQATYSDVAVRYLCANRHPDHDSICTFRRENAVGIQAAFVKVLQLAHELKLTRVGTISVDGTKILANASKHAAVSYERAGQLIEQLELEVKELLERAEQADAKEAPTGLDVPAELVRREQRLAALRQARQVIEQRAQEMAAAKQAKAKPEQEGKPKPPAAKSSEEKPEPKAQYNFTDPESRIMKAGSGQHFEQAYNAQAAVDQQMLIVGQRVSPAANDKQELVATVVAISPVVAAEVQAVLVDSGFYSEAAVRAIEQKADGTPSGLTVYAAVAKHSHHKTVADLLPPPEPGPLPVEASAQERMAHRLKTELGRALYKLRKQTVEPVFGIIKEAMGFRRFRLRGREKVSLEWTLVCVSYNLKRMFALKNLAKVT